MKKIDIEVTINGITRTYSGDYHELHSQDWNEQIREQLDREYYAEKVF